MARPAPRLTSDLLERERPLATLAGALDELIADGSGTLILIGGEAGVGKTALVHAFSAEVPADARVLWGACDSLFTPRPLAPLLDVAQVVEGELYELVHAEAKPRDVAAALLRELSERAPTVLILEDLHWADDATLDVLRVLGRRIKGVPVLVLATYRNDELHRAHPLRIVFGELATSRALSRLQIERLSPDAVTQLAEPTGVDGVELYRLTGGNPFFVTEALAAGEWEIPHTVRDAVLARAARLSGEAAALLEAVSVVHGPAELWFLEALADGRIDALEECLSSGILVADRGIAFRHELARLAIEQSLPPNRARELHERALAALTSAGEDPARLAHHADAAGDVEAVLRWAPEAAERASALGAHHQAVGQYARALRFADGAAAELRAVLLERQSYECHVTEDFDEAIAMQRRACALRRELGDRPREGAALRWLSRVLWFAGRVAEADEAGREAVTLLERLDPGRELALAYANLAHVALNLEDAPDVEEWGGRALAVGEALGDTEVVAVALNSIGTMELLSGDDSGKTKLERSLELARGSALEYDVARAYAHFAWAAWRRRDYHEVDRQVAAGLAYCGERDLELTQSYLLAVGAHCALEQGRWTDAAEAAAQVLRDPPAAPLDRVLALAALGLIRARRGDPDVWTPLDEARALAEPTGELQRIAPVAAARAEAAWLEGASDAIEDETNIAFELAVRRGSPPLIGQLAWWRRLAGLPVEITPDEIDPYVCSARGDWRRASERWAELGCPYEAALALADGDEERALRRSLEALQGLGAKPAAAIVARRLRERGARDLPRGPRAATRRNPAGLTRRELEVLALVVEGLRNGDIAARLVVSERTVDHHVGAILRKLAVKTRGEASVKAVRLGLVT